MARVTDQNRVDRLKQSTMQLVVEKGFGGASAVLIAKNANVAAGYFYLHYHGKYEMVNALLHDVYQEVIDKLKEIIDNGSKFDEIVERLISHFFEMARKEPIKIKFLYVLSNNYNFVIDQKVYESIFQFITKVKQIGHAEGTLDLKITEEDLYLFLVISVIQYINQRFKNTLETATFNRVDEEHLFYLIQKIIK